MVTSHLISFLKSKEIPFNTLDFGVEINRKYYDYDTFKYLNVGFLDTTFIVYFPKNKAQ